MKRLLTLFALLFAPAAFGQSFVGPISITASQCARISADAQATVAIYVSGTWTGTLQPEAAIQGQTPFNVQAAPSTLPSTLISTITANGGYAAAVAGYSTFLLCGNTVASGTATVYLQASASQLGSTIGGASSGGGTPIVPTLPTAGLMAEYRMNPTESAAALVDYSGNGRTAVGTVGTAPTIISGTGGINCTGNGAVKLPAALNSALTVMIAFNYQASSNANAFNAPIMGNAASGNWGILFDTNSTPFLYGPIAGGSRVFSYPGTVPTNSFTFMVPQGTESVAMTMPGTDTFYANGNGLNPASFYQPGSNSAGIQTGGGGQFQLCGTTAGIGAGAQSYLTGNLYWVGAWNRALAAAEIAQTQQYLVNLLAQRAVFFNANGLNTSNTSQAAFNGDSITAGASLTEPFTSHISLNGTWNITNQAQGGRQIVQHDIPAAFFSIDPLLASSSAASFEAFWMGTNDITTAPISPAATFAGLRADMAARKLLGWKVGVATMIPRPSQDANKNTYNALIRQHWTEFADVLIDIAADTNLGADGAYSNATYFQGDQTHPTQTSANNLIAPVFQRAINRFYGNRDWTSATTYVAAALAATATTAGSEATNTVTITFGATPANCQVNTPIVIAGTTPAGYSNGGGNPLSWTILTRSATQITFFNNTTGLGAITVQGTGVCPQQQDADVFQILNFVGNYTLEPSIGYTGQSLCFKNINAGSPVIVPFGAETINGAASFTMTAGSKVPVCFQAQLVSAAAGGSNWVQTQ